ncbi:MAG: hypothetical protein KatS3mg031_1960 [Chitinophagales bacterium]|nr:MAG: hypothetical protein KatS3mg031_1960 [Chitinophagales bacterium]
MTDTPVSRITDYIRNYLPGSVIINCKKIKDAAAGICYQADVVRNDIYHHLKFTLNGEFISEVIEPQFTDGYHEHYF